MSSNKNSKIRDIFKAKKSQLYLLIEGGSKTSNKIPYFFLNKQVFAMIT